VVEGCFAAGRGKIPKISAHASEHRYLVGIGKPLLAIRNKYSTRVFSSEAVTVDLLPCLLSTIVRVRGATRYSALQNRLPPRHARDSFPEGSSCKESCDWILTESNTKFERLFEVKMSALHTE
jgi:hypothetical protein